METDFGIQDKKRQLHGGTTEANGLRLGPIDVVIKTTPEGIDFSGPFVHGTRGVRFLYLGWRLAAGPENEWFRRWKIALAGITSSLIGQLGADDGLVTHVDPDRRVWIGMNDWTIERGAGGI
jgi:Family of unknown function (DUF5990)